MEAPNIFASRVQVSEWDGVTISPLGFATGFYSIQAAPDGKLYAATVSSSQYLHIIHRPDEPGLACKYEQHGIVLPTQNAFSLPSFPNYRQSPLDGSACDTLGLDNHPVARWRYVRPARALAAAVAPVFGPHRNQHRRTATRHVFLGSAFRRRAGKMGKTGL